MVLYFTGTGNSRYVAKQIADSLEDEIKSLNDYMKSGTHSKFQSKKPFIIVTPDYMSRMPIAVEKFIRECTFTGSKDVYFILTGGEAAGNAHIYCKKLSDEKGMNYKGTTSVAMPANYVVMYDVTPKSEALKAAEKAKPAIDKIAATIKAGKMLETNPEMSGHKAFSRIAPIFTSLMVSSKSFRVNSNCIGCSKCEKLCPLNNISIKNNKPVWSNNCMHCMACISACPQKAINYGKKTENRNRYYLDVK